MQIDGVARTRLVRGGSVGMVGREVNVEIRRLLWHLGSTQVDQLENRAVPRAIGA